MTVVQALKTRTWLFCTRLVTAICFLLTHHQRKIPVNDGQQNRTCFIHYQNSLRLNFLCTLSEVCSTFFDMFYSLFSLPIVIHF